MAASSAGIACALDLWLNDDGESLWSSPYKTPNPLCFERVCEAAGIDVDRDEIRRRYDESSKRFETFTCGGYEKALDGCFENREVDGEVSAYSDKEPGRLSDAWEDIADRLGDDCPLASGFASLIARRSASTRATPSS